MLARTKISAYPILVQYFISLTHKHQKTFDFRRFQAALKRNTWLKWINKANVLHKVILTFFHLSI